MKSILFTAVFVTTLLGSVRLAVAETKSIDFSKDVRSILSDKCFACHGPDEHTREADLRLDLRDEALEALSPGRVNESTFVQRILAKDSDEKMPPPASHKELSDKEIQLLKQWIAEGAAYQQHWSFQPLKRSKIPAIKHAQNKNAIDALILEQLPTGLNLAPPASKTTLVRRLYLDLLGVPPTPAQVDAFVGDTSPDAWEKLVDTLLGDQRFGERMAVYWLDLVRYADTIGYHSDTHREVSAYRDYVIDAFNQNKPFDQFTREQLAGDLIPDATDQQIIASGYNRLLQTTEEGGAQAKEYMAIYAADRVRSVSGVWMGLTVGCAQCHDHKYDPITAKDFYSLAAFFADIKETAVGKQQPNFQVKSPQDESIIESLQQKIDSLEINTRLENDDDLREKVSVGQTNWERETLALVGKSQSVWDIPEPTQVDSTGGVKLVRQDDGSYLHATGTPERGDYTYSLTSDKDIRAIRLEIFPDSSFPRKTGFSRGNGNIVLSRLLLRVNGNDVKLTDAVADYEQQTWPISAALDDDPKTGWAVDGHHKDAASHQAVFRIDPDANLGQKPYKIEVNLQHQSDHGKHLIGRFRIGISERADAGLTESIELPGRIMAIIQSPKDQRSDAHVKRLAQHYQSISPELDAAKRQHAAAVKELAKFEQSVQTMLVTQRLDQPQVTRILPRGNWLDDTGQVVQPATLAFLPGPEGEGNALNRLDLANWLFRDDNPLTARTFANRIWSLLFGRGISPNLDDLGGQGQPPTHPELLDYLANQFRESGWDVKYLIRLIVTSGAYQQSSVATAPVTTAPVTTANVTTAPVTNDGVLQTDPGNVHFARQGRWRIDAEFIRDSALQLSGLLDDETIGGPSVKPYQPAGYWQHLNFPKRTWQASTGKQLYRRTLYTYWCRSFLHPSLLAFDAPSREECTAKRARSNIPQQALALLNDPVYVEASRAFAQRIIDAADSTDQRIAWAFQQATSRDATDDELAVLRKLVLDQTARFVASPDDAKMLISVGESTPSENTDPATLATWTQVARAILNAYETTSRY
ncbi:MAG: PSD1 and planctomycete cytochrome C domain-containing protein [Pirellulaceae bacterium]